MFSTENVFSIFCFSLFSFHLCLSQRNCSFSPYHSFDVLFLFQFISSIGLKISILLILFFGLMSGLMVSPKNKFLFLLDSFGSLDESQNTIMRAFDKQLIELNGYFGVFNGNHFFDSNVWVVLRSLLNTLPFVWLSLIQLWHICGHLLRSLADTSH